MTDASKVEHASSVIDDLEIDVSCYGLLSFTVQVMRSLPAFAINTFYTLYLPYTRNVL